MARDPFSWADRVSDQGFNDKQNSNQYSQNALLTLFAEEAARQRPYATMPAVLAQNQYERMNAEPFQIAREQRALENDMALRRYYAENPIPRATEDGTAASVVPGAMYTDPASGRVGTTFQIGGKTMVRYEDGTVEYL